MRPTQETLINSHLNQRSQQGQTLGNALHADFFNALRSGDFDYVRARLDAGVSPDVQADVFGAHALVEALTLGKAEIADLLIDRGANVNVVSYMGRSPLYAATGSRMGAQVEKLLRYGANPDGTCAVGATALHVAGSRGDVEMCDVLLRAGANVDSVADDGDTPLHRAAEMGQCAAVKFLVQRGAHINCRTRRDMTPLHMAAHYGHVGACAVLCDLGASPAFTPDVVPPAYLTPFQLALGSGREAVAIYFMFERGEKLLQRTADGRPMGVVAKGHPGLYQRLRMAQRSKGATLDIDAALGVHLDDDQQRRPSRLPQISPI